MIVGVQLTSTGAAKFRRWFGGVARRGIGAEVVAIDLCDVMADHLSSNQSLLYELRGQYAASGRPQRLCMDRADLQVLEEIDE